MNPRYKNHRIINAGFLQSPLDSTLLLVEYGLHTCDVKPSELFNGWFDHNIGEQEELFIPALISLASDGIPFAYEYFLTEDVVYLAYNFPTYEKNDCIEYIMSRDRKKNFPRVSNKRVTELTTIFYKNRLLKKLGVSDGNS